MSDGNGGGESNPHGARQRRPRPRARVVIDPNNAYGRLGVSPLTSTEDIARILREKRGELLRQARARGESGEQTAAVVELQKIEAEIGDARARAAYDQAHPQNELLTVQPAPADRWLDPRSRVDLVTAWLREQLPPEDAGAPLSAALPHPECVALWAPSPELLSALAPFVDRAAVPAPAHPPPATAPSSPRPGNERDNAKP